MPETMYLVSNNQLSSIGNSIRTKLGESTTYTVDEMPQKISSISGSLNIPTFTEDENTGEITCDKTYAECLDLLDNIGDTRALYYVVSDNTTIYSSVLTGITYYYELMDQTVCRYYGVNADSGKVSAMYEYYPDGTILITFIHSSKHQAYRGYATVNAASYTTTSVSLTVAESGYYNFWNFRFSTIY